MGIRVLDKDWMRQSFMLPKNALDGEDIFHRQKTKGYYKFSDLTLGGCQALNPLPQFSKFTDIREERMFQTSDNESSSSDMGRWYSENVEDHNVYIHVRCGNPIFNSLTTFFSGFYDSQAASMARTGRSNDFFYTLGRVGGFVISWLMQPFIFIGTMWDVITSHPRNRYYYMRPAMQSFWSSVQNILNTIMTNKGMLVSMQPGDDPQSGANQKSDAEINAINNLLPDIFTRNGQFDIYAVATRYQRKANRLFAMLAEVQARAETQEELTKVTTSLLKGGGFLDFGGDRNVSLEGYIERYLKEQRSKPDAQVTAKVAVVSNASKDSNDATIEKAKVEDTGVWADLTESIGSYFSADTKEAMIAELNDGGQFVSFRVNNPGSVGESFQSSTKESAIASTINGMSKGMSDTRFNFADGNLSSDFISKAIGSVVGMAQSFVSGIADSLSISGVASLFGNALVDIPKYWDQSTAQLPTMSYTFTLRQTYGIDLSSVQDMWAQVAALLTMSLPLSTGPSSYTQPMVCELFCEGRAQSRLCMVESLQLTRGVGPKGWIPGEKPTAIDVSITFVDLSSIMHVPITAGFSPWRTVFAPGGIAKLLAGDEGTFNDYMATISSLGLVEQIYPLRKIKRNFYKGMADFNSWMSPNHLASWVGGFRVSRIASGLYAAVSRG